MDRGFADRRIFPRKLLRTKVVFEDEFGEGLFYLYSEDVSLGGLFVSGDIPIKIGSYVFLSFMLPGTSTKISATGQIMRLARESGGDQKKQGMGVRFIGLAEEYSNIISSWLS